MGQSPLQRNPESSVPTAPLEMASVRPKQRASRAPSEEMEELIALITRQPEMGPSERKAIEYRPYETSTDKKRGKPRLDSD